MVLLVLIGAMVFGLWALEAFITYLNAAPPQKMQRLAVTIYCIVMAVLLLYLDGYLGHHVVLT